MGKLYPDVCNSDDLLKDYFEALRKNEYKLYGNSKKIDKQERKVLKKKRDITRCPECGTNMHEDYLYEEYNGKSKFTYYKKCVNCFHIIWEEE